MEGVSAFQAGDDEVESRFFAHSTTVVLRHATQPFFPTSLLILSPGATSPLSSLVSTTFVEPGIQLPSRLSFQSSTPPCYFDQPLVTLCLSRDCSSQSLIIIFLSTSTLRACSPLLPFFRPHVSNCRPRVEPTGTDWDSSFD